MAAIQSHSDSIKWHAFARVYKYAADTTAYAVERGFAEPTKDDFDSLGIACDEYAEADGNLLVTVGLANITKLIIGASATAMTNAQAIVGVGSSATAAAVGDTALGGNGSTTTAYYQGADATYPTQSNGVITCNSTFATGNANFAWNEWCWAVGTGALTAGGTLASVATGVIMLNHKVQSLGTKASGSTWTLQATVTLS